MRLFSTFLMAGLGVLAGCANEGALGQSAVGQACPESNPECLPVSLDAPLAVGASLPIEVDLSLAGGGAPPLTLLSGNEDVFTVEGLTLTGEGPGVASVLITSQESVVLDFTSIWVQTAAGLALHRRGADGSIAGSMPESLKLTAGEAMVVSVSALSSSKQPLLGAPHAVWSADPEVVALVDQGDPGSTRLVAVAAGKTTVKVSALDLQRAFDVEVTP